MDREQLVYKVKHFIPFILGRFKPSGYKLLKKDDRDYQSGSLFGFNYTPKSNRILLNTLSVKDQGRFNTCVFNSAIVCKEIDEGVQLSVRSLVAQASRLSLLSGNGFADLRSAQKLLQDWGVEESTDCQEGNYALTNDFNGYVSSPLDQAKAAIHKIKTYWNVTSKELIYQLLDQHRPIHAAMLWFSGYNQSGGFSTPWLISKSLGYQVGGHAIAIIGYDLNYNGHKVFIIQNSYSALWSDRGKFYVDADFMIKEINRQGFGAYTNLDLSNDVGEFLVKYTNKNVKKYNDSGIFWILDGLKRPFPNMATYLAFDGNIRGFVALNADESKILNQIQVGDSLDIIQSDYWYYLKNIHTADDKNDDLIRLLLQMQYNKKIGVPLNANLE
jgi:hypothetical protein